MRQNRGNLGSLKHKPRKALKMKLLYVALIASTLTSPVLAFDLTAVTAPSATEDVGRRSGNCANRPNRPEQVVLPGQVIGRVGSTCGGA